MALTASDFHKQVNASIVDPGFVARVRKKVALEQREAAAIFDGGTKTRPPLDRHPSLLNEVRAGQ